MIDWQTMGQNLAATLDLGAGEWSARPEHGGDINQAFCLSSGKLQFFVKLNRAELLPMFEAEKAGLEVLRRSGAIRVPEVYLTGLSGQQAFIAMEFIAINGRPDPDRFARQLAALHRHCHSCFGFDCDNTIGSTPQRNDYSASWTDFWRQQRLEFQLELARSNGLSAGLIESGYQLAAKLDSFFAGYQPSASLLHGDLWGGNQGADSDGNPVIYDPACYYGDHEADLAMMELFGSPGARFFAVYHEHFAIDPGYPQRRELYNLYHLLNHANLFGGGYPGQAQTMINHLLAQT